VKLYYTDDEYVVAGVARPGIPFLCDKEMELVSAPNRYLDHLAIIRGRTRSPKTWKTYGEHLYEFFAFAEDNGIAWDTANEREIAAWRDSMLERGNKNQTVNDRLRCLHRFYEWAARSKLTVSVPFSREAVTVSRSPAFLAHVDASGGKVISSELMLPTQRRLPKFLHVDRAIQFLDALMPKRLRLMGYVMLLTGMRREEVAELDYRVLPNPAGQPENRALDMVLDPALTKTKGNKLRTVKVPYQLAQALYFYFTWERPVLERAYLARYGKETTRLFMSQDGELLSVNAVTVAFNEASKRVGIKCHPHMLRHTFGTYEFIRMSAKKGKERALMWVRDRLGHSSIVTTEIYVDMADVVKNDTVDGYVADVCKALIDGD